MKRHSALAILVLAFPWSASTAGLTQKPTTSPEFEVVSIRQSTPNLPRRAGTFEDEITPGGWRLNDAPLFIAILKAYIPSKGGVPFYQPGQILGIPGWARSQTYSVDAKIGEADLVPWRNPSTQPEIFRAMMQAMLATRCKLVVHRAENEEMVYSLVVAKSGIKFKESDPAAPHPHGYPLPGGGEFLTSDSAGAMHFYDAPAAAIAAVLSNVAGRSVQDDTGLTGRYDLALQRPHMSNPSQGVSAADDGPTIFSIVGDLGLKLIPAKRSVETLVIDHIEPPSEN